jgi:hypothetical protein
MASGSRSFETTVGLNEATVNLTIAANKKAAIFGAAPSSFHLDSQIQHIHLNL